MASLKASEIKAYREKQLEAQAFICPLCYRSILPSEAALDHCHSTGKVRRVLHRWCNSVLGRVENWATRSGINKIEFLKSTVAYLEAPQTIVTHPSHGKKRRKANGKAKRKPRSKKVVHRRNR